MDTKIDFMRKSRFDTIKDKFTNIDETAQTIISEAKNEDILELRLTFTNPISITSARIMTEKDFIELAF